MAIKKPARQIWGKPKRVARAPNAEWLKQAALHAVYDGNQNVNHCPDAMGRPPRGRAKPASICPRRWTDEDATKALREAVARGNVSEAWEDGFPRYVWHRAEGILYEARHTRGPAGLFHAYPIEDIQAPRGLRL
jgi:hypothetical protein